jgi:hypothetical protein
VDASASSLTTSCVEVSYAVRATPLQLQVRGAVLSPCREDEMTKPAWKADGQYYETCSCDFVCPCLPGQMAVSPTNGSCTFAMAFQIERGKYGKVSLDGLGFSWRSALHRRDRILIVSCILIITALSWAYLVHLHQQMSSSHETEATMI